MWHKMRNLIPTHPIGHTHTHTRKPSMDTCIREEIRISILDWICSHCLGLGVQPQGRPGNPRPSLETSREKCATKWKSQHSQPSQIAIESIYSTLGKTRTQALIMRERVRDFTVAWAISKRNTRRSLVFIYPSSGLGYRQCPLCYSPSMQC